MVKMSETVTLFLNVFPGKEGDREADIVKGGIWGPDRGR